jgi:hypothetical protein
MLPPHAFTSRRLMYLPLPVKGRLTANVLYCESNKSEPAVAPKVAFIFTICLESTTISLNPSGINFGASNT